MSQNANNLIDRLKQELSIKKDKELCELLDIKHNTLSSWRKRDSIDFNKVIAICESKGLDLNFIFFDEFNEEEKENLSTLTAKPSNKESAHKLIPLISSKLVNANRNIGIFINVKQKEKDYHNEIIVTQRLSIKKLNENIKYVFELKSGRLLMDTLLIDKTKSTSTILLVGNVIKLKSNDIAKVWQVLGESMITD
jgi:glycerophosphoryl diester phosphodiesterase